MHAVGGAVGRNEWQDIPLGLDPRVRDLLGSSVALNTTASVKPDQESGVPWQLPPVAKDDIAYHEVLR